MNWFRKIFLQRNYELLSAIDVLCEVHTSSSSIDGFIVQMGAVPDRICGPPYNVYIDAWCTLRETVNRPVKRRSY